MSIRKLRQSWWVDFQFNRIRYRRRSPENSRAGAKAYEALLRQKLAYGESINEDQQIGKEKIPTLEEFVVHWFDTYVKSNNSPSEIRNKECSFRLYLNPFFGKYKLDKISPQLIEEYKAKMTKTRLSNKTINKQLTMLLKCLRTAQDWQYLEKVPKIKKLKVAPIALDFLTQEESRILLDCASGIWKDVLLVALHTGMRRGELLALTWENINWQTGTITVCQSMCNGVVSTTKSNKIRYIDMTKEVYSRLSERKKSRGFVFTDEKGETLKTRRINDVLDQVCKKAGIRKIKVHTLRHTFASHLAMAGAPIQAIQGLLGHSDIQTTMRYAHLSKSVYRDTIKLLDPKPVDIKMCQHSVNISETEEESFVKANKEIANIKTKTALSDCL